MKKTLWMMALLAAMGSVSALELNTLKLSGVQKKEDGLYFDGKSCATVPGGEKINVTSKGLTILLTLKAEDAGTVNNGKDPAGLDAYCFKDGAFLFGRNGGCLYVVVFDKNGTFGHTLSGRNNIPAVGKWNQVAAVFSIETQNGKTGTNIALYLNGKLVGRRFTADRTPLANDKALTLGKGWGGPWHFRGTIGACRIVERAMTLQEISEAAQDDPLLKKAQ